MAQTMLAGNRVIKQGMEHLSDIVFTMVNIAVFRNSSVLRYRCTGRLAWRRFSTTTSPAPIHLKAVDPHHNARQVHG